MMQKMQFRRQQSAEMHTVVCEHTDFYIALDVFVKAAQCYSLSER